MVQMTPLLTSAIAGVADGVLVKQDADAGRVETTKQWATWYEAALLAGGLLMSMGSFGYQFGNLAEPITGAGAALLGSRLTGWAMRQNVSPMVSGASIPSFSRGYVAPAASYGAVNKQPTDSLI